MLVILALVSVVLAAIFVPQPRIRLTSVRYETTSCDPVTISFVATAAVTLSNEGTGDGAVVVRFYVDGLFRTEATYVVSARSTIERALDVVIEDCSPHRYSVDTYFPSNG